MARIYVPPYLEKCEYLIGADEERGANSAIRHDYRPAVPTEKIDQARHKLADGALHPSIVNHIVSDGEPEDGAGVLITRRISNPDVSSRAVGVNAVGGLLALNARGKRRNPRNQAAG